MRLFPKKKAPEPPLEESPLWLKSLRSLRADLVQSCTRLDSEASASDSRVSPPGTLQFSSGAFPEFTVEPQGVPVSHAALQRRRAGIVTKELRRLRKAALLLQRQRGGEFLSEAEAASFAQARESFDRSAWSLFLTEADPWVRYVLSERESSFFRVWGGGWLRWPSAKRPPGVLCVVSEWPPSSAVLSPSSGVCAPGGCYAKCVQSRPCLRVLSRLTERYFSGPEATARL